jgi:dipeptidyl aminopeptidase/acylaminoacyl peptidase
MVVQNAQQVASVSVRPTATALAETSDATKYFLPDDPDDLLKADPARRSPVSFRSGDLTLAGHLYRPPHAGDSERTPAVALCGPISSVKEQTLPHYAKRLAEAGYTALTFDPRAIDFHTSVLVPARSKCHISASRFVIEMTGSKPSDLTRS